MSGPVCPICGGEGDGPLSAGPCRPCLRGLTQPPAMIGEYELCDDLEHPRAQGATSTIHLAIQRASGEFVALKLPKPEASAESYLRQARIERALRHQHIARAQPGPTHRGKPTLVMPFMDGGRLTKHEARNDSLARRLDIALKITRAVQFAHEHGITHCDVKADNILLDARGEPHLSDFGLARTLVPSEDAFPVGGTRGWMSPEQLCALKKLEHALKADVNATSDVFSLGILIHWLVTSELPFGGDDFWRRVLDEEPPMLPPYTPDLGWGLRAIARRAMQKRQDVRYATAEALANDLERLRDDRPLLGVSIPAYGRVYRFANRNPGARRAVLVLLPCFALVAAWMLSRQWADLKRSVLEMNAYAASGQAATVLYQLRDYADEVTRGASSREVQALVMPARPLALDASGRPLPNQNPCRIQTSLADPAPLRPFAARFSTMGAFDSSGCPRARVAEEATNLEFIQRRFDWRDYFDEARADAERPARTSWVRKAYRSSLSGMVKFAVSTPLFDSTSSESPPPFIGVLTASLTVASTLGLPRTQGGNEPDQLTVVLGPFEGRTPEQQRTDHRSFTFLAHPKLGRGAKVTLAEPLATELRRTFQRSAVAQFELPRAEPFMRDDYQDPLLGERWLAAFAPVGGTGYVVLVQTRETVAARPLRALRQLTWALALLSTGLLVSWCWLLLWSSRAQRTAERND